MTALYKRPERFFIPGWAVASTVGVLIVWAFSWATVSIIEDIIGGTMQVGDRTSPTEDVLLMYIFVPLLGLLTGFFQWLLLRQYLPRIGWWILATFLGWLLAAAVLFVLYSFIFQSSSPDNVWVFGCTFIVIGGSLGFTQWLTLRKRINKDGWWIPANVLGWILMGLVNGKSTTGPLEIATLALIPAVVTGIGLWYLLSLSNEDGRPEQFILENQSPYPNDAKQKLKLRRE